MGPFARLSRWIQCYSQGSHKQEAGNEENQRDDPMSRIQQDIIGFKDREMWPCAKGCEWPLESVLS